MRQRTSAVVNSLVNRLCSGFNFRMGTKSSSSTRKGLFATSCSNLRIVI